MTFRVYATRQNSYHMTATKMDKGVADCSVSSTLTTHRTPRLCNSRLTTFTIPSLPKLHGKAALVTTKLCEPVSNNLQKCIIHMIYIFSQNLSLFITI